MRPRIRALGLVALVAILVAVAGAHATTAALTVTITSGPEGTVAATDATFAFTADARAATFTCSLDGARAAPCTSPADYRGLAEGTHFFVVVATAGRETGTARRNWTIAHAQPAPPVPQPPPGAPAPIEVLPPPPDPPPPPPGAQLWLKLLLPQIGANCAFVREQKTGKVFFQKNPDNHCWTGSTAKIYTLHVALEAARNGTVALTDAIPYSQKMVDQACTCMGNYAKDNSYDAATSTWTYPPKSYAHLGETISLKDALRGVAMSAAEPTVGIAEFVANAHFHGQKATGATTAASTSLEKEFVTLMNAHVAALGLSDTLYANEHGGAGGLPGLQTPYSSARDMVRMWDHSVADDARFLEIMGLRDYDVTTTIKVPVYEFFHFHKGYGYYPKLEGDKNGGVTPPSSPEYSSVVTASTRLGRRLTADVMQSGGWKTHPNAADDTGAVLDYSFHQIFNPNLRGTGTPQPKATFQAIDCYGKSRCITAYLTPHLRLATWNVDVPASHVTQLWNTTTMGKNCMTKACISGPPGPSYSEIDVAHLGVITVPFTQPVKGPESISAGGKTIRLFVTAVRTATREITLTAWRLNVDGSVVKLGTDAGAAGSGVDLKLVRLSPTRFVLGARSQDGTLTYTTWNVTSNGVLTKLAAKSVGKVLEYDLAPSEARPHGFVEVKRPLTLGTVVVARAVSDSGMVSAYATSGTLGDRKYLSIARLGLGRYATAGVSAANDDLDVNLWSVGATGSVSRTAVMGPYASDVTRTDVASLAGGAGVFLAVRDATRMRLFPMEYDARYAEDGGDPDYYKVGAAGSDKAQLLEVAELDTTAAAGDYAAAYLTSTGKLKLRAWRIGPKP